MKLVYLEGDPVPHAVEFKLVGGVAARLPRHWDEPLTLSGDPRNRSLILEAAEFLSRACATAVAVAAGAAFGPCHLCGTETPERHGSVLLGCCRIPGSAHLATVEVCEECMQDLREGHGRPCPEE